MLESELIRLARRGSLESYNRLVLQYQDQVYRQAYWMLGNSQAADSVCQETFQQAYRRLRAFREASICIWLLRIAHRLCLEELRRRPGRPVPPRALAGEAGQETAPAAWLSGQTSPAQGEAGQTTSGQLLQGCLEHLSPDWRAVLTLVDLQGLDYAQTSEILGIPRRAVLARLASARRRLQQLLLSAGALADGRPGEQPVSSDLNYGVD